MKKKLNHILVGLFTLLSSYAFSQISTNPNDYLLRIRSDHGYLYGGPNDSLRSYLMTDLPALYFNKRLMLETGELNSYTGDLKLYTSGVRQVTIQNSTGNVGIGTTNPQSKLDVFGNIRAYQDSTNNYIELGHFANYGFINSVGIGGTLFQNNGINSLLMDNQGRVAIGNITSFPGNYKLFVEGGILTERVRVAIQNTADWSDYVFAETYPLKKLEEVEAFVKTHKHLPNVPSAQTMVNTGLDVAEMDAKLLEKIEEAFLYIIDLNKKVNALESENKQLKASQCKHTGK